jgi:hypothetical protein
MRRRATRAGSTPRSGGFDAEALTQTDDEWIIDIDTAEGIASSADELARFAEALDATRGTTGAATSLDAPTGVISASFSIQAETAVAAADLGVATFRDALRACGLPGSDASRVAVERIKATETVLA